MTTSSQSGLALVIVIWITSLLTLMAASFTLSMRRETTNISVVKENAKALGAAESGIDIAQQMLLLTDKKQRWKTDGTLHSLHFPEADIRLRLFSEQGKIDINKANEALLMKVIQITELANDKQQALVNAILDWRDSDNLIRIDGAEKQQYIDAGLSYPPANKRFRSLEELRLVLGMNEKIYQQILPLITIYSDRSQVNLSLAPREVLNILSSPNSLNNKSPINLPNNNPTPVFAASIFPTANTGVNQVYSVISQARVNGKVGPAIQIIFKKVQRKQQKPFQTLVWKPNYSYANLFSQEMESFLDSEHSSEKNSL